jgi:hypothetical protein
LTPGAGVGLLPPTPLGPREARGSSPKWNYHELWDPSQENQKEGHYYGCAQAKKPSVSTAVQLVTNLTPVLSFSFWKMGALEWCLGWLLSLPKGRLGVKCWCLGRSTRTWLPYLWSRSK